MPARSNNQWFKTIAIIVLTAVIACLAYMVVRLRTPEEEPPRPPQQAVEEVRPDTAEPTVMDYNQLESDTELAGLMAQRKAKYGIDTGIDMVVKSDEAVKVGKFVISMQEIMDDARAQDGFVVEKDLGSSSAGPGKTAVEELGIHVVQPGDNIWNIHFKLLKAYFDRKSVALSPMADEPGKNGYSSGIGRILKFSENMVYIYNVKERRLASDINQIQPLGKIIVYRMKAVFSLLDRIDFSRVNRIQFDGETLWIPADQ